jgi:hypothetical protein
MENGASYFEEELELITDSKLKVFVQHCLNEKVPDYFFTMPASTTGKYHPEYSLGEGGLVRHTKAAVKIANDLLAIEQHAELAKFKSEIIAALILHDSVKKGYAGNSFTAAEHPLCAVNLVLTANTEKKLLSIGQAKLICDLIASHMGQWNTAFKSTAEILPKPKTDLQKFVHMCDYLASRRYLNVDFNK